MAQRSQGSSEVPPDSRTDRQVMSPRRASAVLEGETAGPSYGAVNGIPPMRAGEARAPVLPLGETAAEASLQGQAPMGQPEARRSDNPSLRVDPVLPTAAVTRTTGGVEMRSVEPTAAFVVDGITGPGAERRAEATTATEDITQPPIMPKQSSTTMTPPTTQPPQQSEGLPPPLRQAVSQLAQQRTAVIQAVQARAQRAMQSVRGEELPGEGDREPFASPQQGASVQMREEPVPDRTSSSWSVTRFSEVLHRRFVAPVIEHVHGGERPAASPVWHSPAHQGAQDAEVPPLMTTETRRAMEAWTAQPTILTTPPERRPVRDDSSSASLPQELIMEEVKRQVQVAMQGRDVELKTLKSENAELKQALDASAQLLNEVFQVERGGGNASRETHQERPRLERGGDLGSEGVGPKEPPRAPPGLEGRRRLPEGIPGGGGGSGSVPKNPTQGPTGQGFIAGSNLGRVPLLLQDGVEAEPRLSEGEVLPGPNDGAPDVSPIDVLVQGMRQLQQVYLDKRVGTEAEHLKGSVELPLLPDLVGETGVEFSDWLYVAEQTIGSLTDSAASWFARTMICVKEAYGRHQVASPLERLTVAPVVPKELTEAKWNRLERRVMAMLLSAMPKSIKEDAVTHRVATVSAALFRLHVLYAPGGVAERAAILKQLEGVNAGEVIVDVVAALRKWRRNLTRALEMNVTPPDASVLLRGLELIIGAAVKRHPEMSFRLSLARNELQLQHRPTQETVLKFYDHALSELQQSMPRSTNKTGSTGEEQPRLRAVDGQAGTGETYTQRSSSSSPQKGKGQTACKFFQSEAGCRRGPSCKYAHDFASKEEKKQRCWYCGSKQHRQSECHVKDPSKNPRQGASSSSTTPSQGSTAKTEPRVAASTAPEPKATGAAANMAGGSLSSSTASSENVVVAEPVSVSVPEALQNPEFQTFVKEVNTMLQRMSALRVLQVSESITPELDRIENSLNAFKANSEPMALLDSGATHPFRNLEPAPGEAATPVHVTLADGKSVVLQQNRAGTLMPAKGSVIAEGVATTTIIPLGTLVQELGCTLSWDRRGLRVHHPEHGEITTHVVGACPFIGETQALELIGEIEARKLEQLKINTLESQLRLHGLEPRVSFEARLQEYIRTGKRTEGLRALMSEDSFLGELTEAQRCSLVQDIDLSDQAGFKYLKALPIKRASRRRLMTSRWMVHLYSGTGGTRDFKVLEEDGVMLLEIDIGISKAFNMKEPEPTYKALLWAAMRGQIHGIFGGPPRGDGCGDLVLKQMFLWAVARIAAEGYEIVTPGFAMTMPARSELWTTRVWETFQARMGLRTMKGNPNVMVATSLDLQLTGTPWEGTSSSGAVVWTEEFRQVLVRGFQRWATSIHLSRMDGPLGSMSKEELERWIQHVRQGHLPYNKRCKTCVSSKATGHAHRRVLAPSCHTMSLDVCGPFRVKGHTPEGLDQKYMLVASYTMPLMRRGVLESQDEIINTDARPDGVLPGDPATDARPDGVLPGDPATDARPDGVLPGDPATDARPDGVLPGDPATDARPDGVLPGDPATDARPDGVLPGDPATDARPDGVLPGDPATDARPDGVLPGDPATEARPDGVLPGDPTTDARPDGVLPDKGGDGEEDLPLGGLDLEELFAEEEDREVEHVEEGEREELDRQNKEYNELVAEVGDTFDYQVLRFAVPMRSRRSSEVNARVRQLYLQIRAEGLPVLRCHSDRALELCNRRLRDWLLERGVLYTTGEAQSPQQNGRAEATVKFVKNEARCLLTAARLGKENWPLAMRYAVHRQRLRALGKDEDLPTFGCPVHVRTKIYGVAGHYDIDNKWKQGIYMGPSEEVAHGHVVKFPDNTFVTSQHLKTHLVDSDDLVDLEPREIELPLPERRVRSKTRLAASCVEAPLSVEEERVEDFARNLCRSNDWSNDDVLRLLELLKDIKTRPRTGRAAVSSGFTWTTGMFVHGGVAGLRDCTWRLKWSTRFIVKAAKRLCPNHEFAAVGLLENVGMGCHKDSHNEVDSENAVVLIKAPQTGGDLWLEDESAPPEVAQWRDVSEKTSRKGQCHRLEPGVPFFFSPRRWHQVQPWEGDRVTMVLYSPRATHLHYQHRDTLEFVGFPINHPIQQSDDLNEKDAATTASPRDGTELELHLLQAVPSEVPESIEDALVTLNEDQEQLIEDLEARSARLRLLLEEEEALAEECQRAGRQVADEVDNVRALLDDMMHDVAKQKGEWLCNQRRLCLRAASVAQEEQDFEKMIDELEGDLQVVHTVPLDQVRAALPKWREAMAKEIHQLLKGTLRPMSLSVARDLERQGKLKLVPSKGVCTLKPPGNKGEKLRRRFRLVLCGNFVAKEDPNYDLYAGGVSAETVRLALTIAARKGWAGATSDITAAFLLAEWPKELAKYAIHAPRMLIEAGFIEEGQVWEVLRPLYGLRESPAIWSKCRTARLKSARIPWKGRHIILKPSDADPDLWLVYDEQDKVHEEEGLLGMIVTYVDDLLYLAEDSLIQAIHDWIVQEWPCSSLEWARDVGGTRYLGMEVYQREDGNFEVSQEGYVKELLRNHDMDDVIETRLPCPREWLSEDLF